MLYDPNNEAAVVGGDRLGRFSIIKAPNLQSLDLAKITVVKFKI